MSQSASNIADANDATSDGKPMARRRRANDAAQATNSTLFTNPWLPLSQHTPFLEDYLRFLGYQARPVVRHGAAPNRICAPISQLTFKASSAYLGPGKQIIYIHDFISMTHQYSLLQCACRRTGLFWVQPWPLPRLRSWSTSRSS